MPTDATDTRVEEVLRDPPGWEPPPGFDLRVARLAAAGLHRRPAVRPFRATLLRAWPGALGATVCIALAAPLLLRVAPAVATAFLAHPGEVVLGALALSAGLAAWFAEERLVLGRARI